VAGSAVLPALASPAPAVFDADIARAVDDRAAAVERAAEAEVPATDVHTHDDDDDFDDGLGELTLGQLGVDQSLGSSVPPPGAVGYDNKWSENFNKRPHRTCRHPSRRRMDSSDLDPVHLGPT